MPVTPNMNMTLPTVGVTVDPTWASNLNDALTNKVDAHDHTTGLGVKVPTAGLNINADLSFQSNDATNLRSLALINNVSTLPIGDVRALYASGGNLYYNNNSGTPIQLTTGSSLNTGALALNVWELTELAGNLTIPSNASYVVVNTDTSASRTINLPAANAVTAGRYFIIKDKTGDADTNNITVTPAGADTIDQAASSSTINTSFGSLTLISDGVSNWLTDASLGGTVRLGGDLLGTGSTAAQPRVGTLTGIAGLITFVNNTALNTRNALNNTNVNVAKMNGSNVMLLADTAFATTVQGSSVAVTASSTTATVTGATTATLQAGSGNATVASTSGDVVLSGGDDVTISAADDMTVTVVDTLTMSSASASITTSGAATVGATGALNLTSGTDVGITATDDVNITATDEIAFAGKLMFPTKAVTSSTYTVDTTTKDYIILCDSTATAITITLPTATTGRTLIIQDVGGNAGTNNITLARAGGTGSIQGLALNYVMDGAYQGVTMCAYGGDWFIVATS